MQRRRGSKENEAAERNLIRMLPERERETHQSPVFIPPKKVLILLHDDTYAMIREVSQR